MGEIHPSICRICSAHCPILVEVEDGRAVKVSGDPTNDLYQGYTCPKGRALPEMHANPARLLHSLRRDPSGDLVPIGSEDAMGEVAELVARILAEHGPRSVALYIGTNALPYPASPAAATAFFAAVGSRMIFSSNTIDQPGKQIATALHGRWQADENGFETADTWLLVGVNPVISKSTGVPGQNPGRKITDAVERGMQLVVIDPRRTEAARHAVLHLQPRPGEDPTILAGIVRVVIEDGLVDTAFVEDNAEGFDALRTAVQHFTPEYVAQRAGVDAADVVRAGHLFGEATRGVRVRRHRAELRRPRGTLTEYLCLCLTTLCGRWARAGEDVLRPNVLLPAYEARAQPYPPYRAWGFGERMRVHDLTNATCGMPTAALADEMLLEGEGQVKALFCLGGNPMMAWPDQRHTKAALESLDLLVTFDTELSATSEFADYVIAPRMTLETPGMSQPAEALKYFTIGIGFPRPWARYSPRIVEPPPDSDLVEEWQFFHGLARRMGISLNGFVLHGWGKHIESPPTIYPIDDEHPPTTDKLYEAMTSRSRVPLSEVKAHPHGKVFDEIHEVVLPRAEDNTDRLQLADPHMIEELRAVRAEDTGTPDDPTFPYRLVSRRSNNFMNSSGRSISRLTRKRSYNPAFLHPDDLASLGVGAGDAVEIRSCLDAVRAVVQPDDSVRRGVVSMTHTFGGNADDDDRFHELGANTGRLIPVDLDYDRVSGIPRMGALPVAITRLGQDDRVAD